MSVLEDLWFDNLIVNDAEIKKGSEAERLLAAMVRSDNALEDTLTEQQKEQFQNGCEPVWEILIKARKKMTQNIIFHPSRKHGARKQPRFLLEKFPYGSNMGQKRNRNDLRKKGNPRNWLC